MEYRRVVEDVFAPLRDRLTLRCRVTLLDRRWPTLADEARTRLQKAGQKAPMASAFSERSDGLEKFFEELAPKPEK